MKFELTLYDRKGVQLNEGDIVKVSDGKSFKFYSEVKYLEKEQSIAPFHTFCFHSFEKVDKVPEGLNEGTGEERYRIWYDMNAEPDTDAKYYENYFMDWRKCERMMESPWRVKKIEEKQGKLF